MPCLKADITSDPLWLLRRFLNRGYLFQLKKMVLIAPKTTFQAGIEFPPNRRLLHIFRYIESHISYHLKWTNILYFNEQILHIWTNLQLIWSFFFWQITLLKFKNVRLPMDPNFYVSIHDLFIYYLKAIAKKISLCRETTKTLTIVVFFSSDYFSIKMKFFKENEDSV